MPALKRKYVSTTFTAPRKKRKSTRYEGATSRKLPMSLDHKLLRQTQSAVLRYHETFAVNPGALGTPGYYAFRANSCFDPNYSGVGHQPRGFDELMKLYEYCAVREVQLEIWFTNSDGGSTILSISQDAAADSASNLPTKNKMMEARTAVFARTGGISADGPGYISIRCKPWQLAGLALKDADYKHTDSASAATTQFLNVRGVAIDSSDVGNIHCTARFTFHVVLTEPRDPGAS